MSNPEQKKHTWEDEFQEIQDLLFDHNNTQAFARGMALVKNPNAPHYYQIQGCIIAAYAEPGYYEAERLPNSAYLLFYGWKMRYNGQIVDEDTQKIFDEVEEQLQELGRNIVPVTPALAVADTATPAKTASPEAAALQDMTLTASTIDTSLKTFADTPAESSTPARQMAKSKSSVEFGNPAVPTAIPLLLRSTPAQINSDVRHSIRLSTILRDNSWRDDPSVELSLKNFGTSEQAEGSTESSVIGPGKRIDAASAHRHKTESGVASPPSDHEIKPTLAQPDP